MSSKFQFIFVFVLGKEEALYYGRQFQKRAELNLCLESKRLAILYLPLFLLLLRYRIRV